MKHKHSNVWSLTIKYNVSAHVFCTYLRQRDAYAASRSLQSLIIVTDTSSIRCPFAQII